MNPDRVKSVTLALALFLMLGCPVVMAHPWQAMTLTNAADVLALPDDIASNGIPVSVTGIVTAAQPNWSGRFFIQDSSGGVFVENRTNQPSIGDVVNVSGVTRAGGYAPCITRPHLKKLGVAPLPAATRVTIDQLMSGTEDGQRVEITGVVREAQLYWGELRIEVVSGGYRFFASLPVPEGTNLQALVGAKVLLRGTAATDYNAALRHIVTVTLYLPQTTDFIIKQPAPGNPYAEPLTALNAIAQYRKNRQPGSEVHVKGVVTFQRKGEDLFLQDSSGGLEVKSKLDEPVAQGQVVEAVGFPAVENFLPVLDDADFRKTGKLVPQLLPQTVSVTNLQKGLHHADYIALRGVLVDRLGRGIGQTVNGPVFRTTLVLQNSNLLFEAEKDTTDENNYLASIPIGSVVEASGVCFLESDENRKIKSVRILLPSSYNVRVLKTPGWLTTEHLLASLAVVSGILVLAISWSVMMSNKNSKLKAAQKELQEAHDLLEWRVDDRTKQLKVEMTARKESELQFRAVLTERTRLAQELHDTLEQTITGIALQLDRVVSHFGRNADTASHHLKLARNLTRQGQTEVRHSVWGLRSRAAEKFNLVNALSVTGRQIANGAGIEVQVETSGEIHPLSDTFEENLLRIGQEAVTNAVKHSGANNVKIELQFTRQGVVLQIKDDGQGFDPDHCIGPDEGHFGLLGIRERAERMGGNANISSTPGAGACVHVEIPIHQNGSPQSQTDFET